MIKTAKIWLTIAILMTLLAIGLGIGWGVTSRQKAEASEALERHIEGGYRSAYYDLTYHLGNLSDTFNKLTVAGSKEMQMQLLGKANVYATGAEQSLTALTDASPEWGKLVKLINQTGDYALALQTKLQRGDSLSGEDESNLQRLYEGLLRLEKALSQASDELQAEGYSFVANLGKEGDAFGKALDGLGADINYPALIYDGPFSDALDDRVVKGIKGEQITQEQAAELATVYLPQATRVEYAGDLTGDIPAYTFEVTTPTGDYRAAITKQGGYLMTLSQDAEPQDTLVDEEQAKTLGEDFLTRLGLTDMQAVWVSNYNSVYYLNYAYTVNDTVVYGDLAVVKINAETGEVMGLEALNYLYNHTARTIPSPKVSEQQARAAIHGELRVESVRLALIPTEGGEEKLTWEVYGTKGEDQYFVYVDAEKGYEYKILRVVDSGEGRLLL